MDCLLFSLSLGINPPLLRASRLSFQPVYSFSLLDMEDYSVNSSDVSKQRTKPKEDEESVEESGWTAYFEDFSNDNHQHDQQQQNNYCPSFSCGSSLISDAATTRGSAWKPSDKNTDRVFPKKLRFKKTRTKQISDEDDSLEDTASSPVNSPKVSDAWKPNDMNPRKREDQTSHSSLGKESAENCSDIHIEEDNKFSDCTELNKRGLCLVPFSMFVNYLG